MRTRLAPLTLLLIVLTVGFASAVGLRVVDGYEERHREHVLAAANGAAQANLISATEWQAIAAGTVSVELGEQRESQSAQLRASLAPIADEAGLKDAAETYLIAVGDEFSLIQQRKLDEAKEFDETRVDPSFELLQEAVQDQLAHHRAEAARAGSVGTIGTFVISLGGALLIAALLWRVALAGRRAESARAEQSAMLASESRFRALVQNSSDMITVIGADATVLYQSPASARVLGYDAAELEGTGASSFVHPDDFERLEIFFAEAVEHDATPMTMEARLRHGDGSWRQVEILASNRLTDEHVGGFVLNIRDITERKQAQQTLRQALADLAVSKAQLEEKSAMLERTLVAEREHARRDPLTNALNHGAISEALRDLVSGAHTDVPACAVAMVDVDGMKAVNDTYGHQAGDMVLTAVANALARSGALVGRYGGDEFVVILQGAGREEAERYRDAVLDDLTRAKLVEPETQASIPLRVSVGLAIYPEEAQSVVELVALSDSAMYAAKRERSVGGGGAGPRVMGDDRAAKMVGEMAPLLTSPGNANAKLQLVAHRLSVGAGYDAVDCTLFAPTPGEPLASNAFARIPADMLEAWNHLQATDDSTDPHPLRTYFARSPRPVIIEEFASSDLVTPDQCAILAAAGLRSGLVAPLIFEDEVVGMLAVGSKRHGAFTAQDAQFVGNVATQVTAIVRMAQLVDELQEATARLAGAQAETVMMLAAAAEAHDRETGLHLLSIRTLAEALARQLGYAETAVHDLGLAAVLHDIGKISVPDTVLSSSGSLQDDEWELMKRHTLWGAEFLGGKPGFKLAAVLHDIGKISVPDAVLSSSGSLQDDEWEMMKRHTLWGAEFLSGKPGFDLAATVARSHHERWDGGGYPDGLVAGDIPEAAAIVTVADSFDAMTHDRPYKAGRPVEDAVSEIVACSGKQFSPRVVEALLQLHERGELPHAHAGDAGEERAA